MPGPYYLNLERILNYDTANRFHTTIKSREFVIKTPPGLRTGQSGSCRLGAFSSNSKLEPGFIDAIRETLHP